MPVCDFTQMDHELLQGNFEVAKKHGQIMYTYDEHNQLIVIDIKTGKRL